KILSMTPEAGSSNDGFWPVQSRILDICKTTFMQNYYLAKVAGTYAIARDQQDRYLSSGGYLKYSIHRLGVGGSSFTVNITPVGGDITSAGPAKTYSLAQNQILQDSIAFTLSSGLSLGQTIKYLIGVDNGSYVHYDTITKIYGTPVTLVYNNGSSATANFTTSGTWGVSTTKFVSPPGSITESPSGNYSGNANKSITLNAAVDLSGALHASLQYYVRFVTEKNYDNARVLYSINNGATWNPLCTKYQTSPASSGSVNPAYDGFQDDWVKEDVDITAYAGQNFLVRFTFNSDVFDNKDGFYFDDLLIRKVVAPDGITKNTMFDENIVVSPNPSGGIFNLMNLDGKEISVEVMNALGQVVYQKRTVKDASARIDLKDKSPGLYFIKLEFEGKEVTKKVIVE
ncbi:MAG: putative carboxypeptidase, partial [Bacteroidetes bacterium]|nr:putative carboxypeptidase [Bacteroidota bacterium]